MGTVPLYSYQCDSCGNEFDLRQSFSAEPVHDCPACANTARRRIHAVGVIYKGSGFYTTDYARKTDSSQRSSESSEASSPSSSSSSSESGSSSSSESGSSTKKASTTAESSSG